MRSYKNLNVYLQGMFSVHGSDATVGGLLHLCTELHSVPTRHRVQFEWQNEPTARTPPTNGWIVLPQSPSTVEGPETSTTLEKNNQKCGLFFVKGEKFSV